MNIKSISSILIILISATACSENNYETYHSDVKEPYVLVEGCKFWIYTDSGSTAVVAPKVEKNPQVTVTHSAMSGRYVIKARDCKIVENPSFLPVYKK